MSKIQDFISYINDRTCNKYVFLRLRQVLFDRAKNVCVVSFIYPNDMDLNDESRKEIVDAVKSYIPLENAIVEVRINKSYIERDLILNHVKNFLKLNSALIFNTLDEEDIVVLIGDNVSIRLKLEDTQKDLFLRSNLDKRLTEYLEKQFYASFNVSIDNKASTLVQEEMLGRRLKNIERQSELDSLLSSSLDKYMVTDKKVIVGSDITFNPRYINSINKEFESVVVAGKINFLTERTYKSKRKVKNKDGTEENVEKPLFRFSLKDDTASINAIIFPSKTNYHKMHLLKNGDTIVLSGKVQKYNDSFDMVVKDISLCSIPSKHEVEKIVSTDLITEYKYVKPQKYSSLKQTNLFDENSRLSKEAREGAFVVYDFETTGINLSNDEIIEIGALKIVNGEFKEVFTTLVKPKKPIPPDATRVNRITNEMVANCYSIEQIIRDFYLFCKGCQMVGYNSIAFDSVFLERAGKLVGINFDNNQLDAFMLAKQKLKGLRNYKLGTVAKYLEVNLIDAHRALNDVIATAEVFLKLY